MSLLNVGARALLANQVALQTAGHNIANVNTPGYSRQSTSMQTVQGMYTGGGYVGQGVEVQTILRHHSALLTRQAATASSVQAADEVRAARLMQLQEVFSGGPTGLGAAINDMMNAFSDVQSSPTDLTARTVVITRMDETAARLRAASDNLDEITYTVKEQLGTSIVAVNALIAEMALVNGQIARAIGSGQPPNDLFDKRDQIIRDINQFVQTSQVAADDGTIGLFVAGSQPLVLGTTATTLSLGDAQQFPGSGDIKLMFNRPGSTPIELDEDVMGGGTISGLLRYNNNDLTEGRNLLGRMALAIGMNMNAQHSLGLTLDGSAGGKLFNVPTSAPGFTSGSAAGTLSYTDATKFSASDYEIRFTGGGAGVVVRLTDNKVTTFTDAAHLASQEIDGLTFTLTATGAAGESMLFKPFGNAASSMEALVYSPRDLAMANPINASMGSANGGTLQLAGLKATGEPAFTLPAPGGIELQFHAGSPTTFDVIDRSTNPGTPILPAGRAYTSGTPIVIDGWELTLQGSPNAGDTVLVSNALDPQFSDTYTRNSGNAGAMLDLRDVQMFDASTLADGYSSAMAQVGTRTQSSLFAAELSTTIAKNLEADRTAVAGVNLDEEAARLIQYQQAYQASSKMISIAQSIFDSLLQSVGR